MKSSSLFRFASLALVGALVAAAAVAGEPDKTAGTAPPSQQVIACCFHRTQRCPTCLKISSSIEDSVATRLAAESKDGRRGVGGSGDAWSGDASRKLLKTLAL